MKSSLDSYIPDNSLVEDIITRINDRNLSEEKLPKIRKPYQFNASYAKVIQIQAAEQQAKNWAERIEPSKKVKNSALVDLLKALFNSLEVDSQGKVRGLKLVEQLIFLGLATEPASLIKVIIIKILCAAYKEPEISRLKLSLDDLLLFCSGDRKTDYILEKLNTNAEKIKQKFIFSNQIKIQFGISMFGTHKKSKTLSNVSKNNFAGITMADHLTVINDWGKEMDLANENYVDSDEVAHKLVEKGICGNALDAKRMLGPAENKLGKISYQQFQQVFARSMLKGALSSLVGRLSEGPFAKPYFTVSMKLSAYKRKLLIARINPDDGQITKAEGENALRAIEKYKRFVRSISPTK